jgi:hypothetical protein
MDIIQLVGAIVGLGFAAGIRLYATVFVLGVAIRWNWFHLAPGQEHLRVLADPVVLTVAGVACLLEFVSDKIPWVDSLWDSFHTIIRPIGAAVLAAGVVGSVDPALKLILILLCGGVAFTSHSSKAATRLLVNHSPEPFSNIGLSLFEDGLAPLVIWLALSHPLLTAVLVLIFLAGFFWISAKVFRLVRVEWVALWTWVTGPSRTIPQGATQPQVTPALKPEAAAALQVVARNAVSLPDAVVRVIASNQPVAQNESIVGIRCAATKDIAGLRNSIGHLAIVNDQLAFVVRRLCRYHVHRIRIPDIIHAEWKRGLLTNTLVLHTSSGRRTFHVFKDVDVPAA